MKQLIACAVLAFAALLAGCATQNEMALQQDSERITENSKPVLLMTATIKNTYKTSFQPRLVKVSVDQPGGGHAIEFTLDDKARTETDDVASGNIYMLRMELDPGSYEIVGMTARAHRHPVNGFYFAPLHSALDVQGPGVYYLGHVNATVRERRGNEFRAGAPLPSLDQAVSGASGGTFDIEISDQLAADEAAFREKFPQLTGVTIQKAILPQFDRAKAQALWEAH